MPGEPVPQAHDECADQLVGRIKRGKLRKRAAPQALYHSDRRCRRSRSGDVAEEAGANLVERHRATVALKQSADLFVAGTLRRLLWHGLTVCSVRDDDAARALPSPHSSAGNQKPLVQDAASATAGADAAGTERSGPSPRAQATGTWLGLSCLRPPTIRPLDDPDTPDCHG